MSRAEPARLAGDVHRGRVSPRSFVIAAMVWGFGNRGYGPWRTARMLATPDAEDRVAEVLRVARLEGAVPAYEAIAGPCRLDRMGPVFATKLLYFAGAGSRAPGPPPIVLDRLVGVLLSEHGVGLRWARFDSGDYGRYLDLIEAIAQQVEAAPEDVECALFDAAMRSSGGGR